MAATLAASAFNDVKYGSTTSLILKADEPYSPSQTASAPQSVATPVFGNNAKGSLSPVDIKPTKAGPSSGAFQGALPGAKLLPTTTRTMTPTSGSAPRRRISDKSILPISADIAKSKLHFAFDNSSDQ